MSLIAYFFTLCDQDNNPTGYTGLAIAHSPKALFWAIDEYCDPYSCRLKAVDSHAGFCAKRAVIEDGKDVFDDEVSIWVEHELSEMTPLPKESKEEQWLMFEEVFPGLDTNL